MLISRKKNITSNKESRSDFASFYRVKSRKRLRTPAAVQTFIFHYTSNLEVLLNVKTHYHYPFSKICFTTVYRNCPVFRKIKKPQNIIQSSAIPGREPKPTEPCERLEISHACLKPVSEHAFCLKSALQ